MAGGFNLIPPPLWFFEKGIFLREGEILFFCDFCFSVTFDIILRHIFPENVIEFPQIVL